MSSSSFDKFNYLLRPAKQVERKLFIEALHRLSTIGYPIREYTYLGLGSIYYADFILFHKYLYMKAMICAENVAKRERMEFNRPYAFVRLRMNAVADVIAELSLRKRYVVWLDYDYPLNESALQDVIGLVSRLAVGSVFMVTIEADWRRLVEEEDGELPRAERVRVAADRMVDALGRYCPQQVPTRTLTDKALPRYYAEVLQSVCADRVGSGREFYQLFNCQYADGARMLSFGGVIDNAGRLNHLRNSGLFEMPFVRRSANPLEIAIPWLTVREKQRLEAVVRSHGSLRRGTLGLNRKALRDFERYYMHYPTYVETLV